MPGAATECAAMSSLFTLSRTITYREMSIAKAMSVRMAARKDRSEAMRTSVTCDEKEHKSATKVTPAATGCTARPRVAPGPMVILLEAERRFTE